MSQTPNFSSDSQLGQLRAGMRACFLDLRHFFVLTFYNTTPGYESKLLQGQGFVVYLGQRKVVSCPLASAACLSLVDWGTP